jgi:hypothetical protein
MALSGFTALLRDLNDASDAQAVAQSRARERAMEARNLWRDCADNSLFTKAINSMTEGMADMSRGLAAKARELNLSRKAEGRRRLAALIADVDASIAGGLITGEQGAKLDAAIARAAEGLRP